MDHPAKPYADQIIEMAEKFNPYHGAGGRFASSGGGGGENTPAGVRGMPRPEFDKKFPKELTHYEGLADQAHSSATINERRATRPSNTANDRRLYNDIAKGARSSASYWDAVVQRKHSND